MGAFVADGAMIAVAQALLSRRATRMETTAPLVGASPSPYNVGGTSDLSGSFAP